MTIRAFLSIVEIRTKIVSAVGFSVGTLLALRDLAAARRPVDAVALVVAALAVLFVDMGTTAFNSFFDYWRGVDDPRMNTETDKAIARGEVAPGYALLVALACFALAATLGLALAIRTSLWLVPVGVACMAAGFLYNAGPLPLSRTPFGELAAGCFLGPVLVLIAYFAQMHALPDTVVLASLSTYFFVAAILTTNNLCDAENDREAGRRTFPIVFGPLAGRLYLYAEIALGFTTFALAVGSGYVPLACAFCMAIAAVVTALELARAARRGYTHTVKGPSMQGILRIYLAFGAAYCVGIGIDFVGILVIRQ